MNARLLFMVGLRLWAVVALLRAGQLIILEAARLAAEPTPPGSFLAGIGRETKMEWAGILLSASLALVALLLARQIANWFYGRTKISPVDDAPVRVEPAELLRVGIQLLGLYAFLLAIGGWFQQVAGNIVLPGVAGGHYLFLQPILYFVIGLMMTLIPRYLARKGKP